MNWDHQTMRVTISVTNIIQEAKAVKSFLSVITFSVSAVEWLFSKGGKRMRGKRTRPQTTREAVTETSSSRLLSKALESNSFVHSTNIY